MINIKSKDYDGGTSTMGIDFTTHPKGKFHAIDKTRHGIKTRLEHLMNSTKEQFTIGTINIS